MNFKSHIPPVSNPLARVLESAQEKLQGRQETKVLLAPITTTKVISVRNQTDHPPFRRTPGKSNTRDVSSCPPLKGVFRKLRDDLSAPCRNQILQQNLAGPFIAVREGLTSPKVAQMPSGKGSDPSVEGTGTQIQVLDHCSNPVGHDSQEIIRRNEDRCWGDRCSDSDCISYNSDHEANPNILENKALLMMESMDNVEALAVDLPHNDCMVEKTSRFIEEKND